MLTGRVVGTAACLAGLNLRESRIEAGIRRGMERGARGGAGIMKGKASGRPGPRVVTGDFRRSIVGQLIAAGGGFYVIQIGSNAPQAARLEYGFTGPDILGRVYDQPPYPYAGPSGPAILELVADQVGKGIEQALGGAA